MVEYEVVGLEVLWVKVIALRMNCALLIGVVYAPGYDSEVFSKLRTSMERIPPHLRRNILMLGDFNCPNISWSDKASESSERERDLLSLQSSDDRYLVHPQDKAEFIPKTFADEYVDCPVHCKTHLPPLPVRLMEPAISPRCLDLLITTTAILTIVKKLDVNKAAGSSLITNRLLRVAGTAIVHPPSRLSNLIIQTGQFPTVWKKADAVPIPKKGGSAFRPISLLPPLSKLFEKILADHLSNYLYQNTLLSDSQYGFRKQRSTEIQLAQMSHHFSQVLLQRKEADVILLDCTKAFDRIPHDVIVDSLFKHGVTGRLLALFSDYLRG
ncbi:hypothetical protein RvY_10876 [Ramazzottius varieornatus]|uniref:Reverse transcriptase domain-containing protein n=1 Tax=Ramazzottius varieornatus TaxID=947166 RepID=A0A1D1VGN5_RAMVA|nr:hypothetical protein RvY_10876 [Ramazzottius varieornatus]